MKENKQSHTIELKKVSKYYAGESGVSMGFSRVDLSLDIGEFVAITGESGSGKSTLLNVISGLDNYDEGELIVCGEDTAAFKTEDYEKYRKKYIGNIFQDFNLIGSYSVYQNIELTMLLSGKKKSECQDRINELIELVGLTEHAKKKVSKLSGGQKQRVAIARALAKDAPIIVADEPTGNLDRESAEIVMETLSKVSKDRLVIVVTHNYEQVEKYVTRKLTMNDGRLIEDRKIKKDIELSPKEVEEPREMGLGSELRLGFRNTFNLMTKFILLLLVYLFIVTAAIGQYTSTKNKLHQGDILGSNMYFINTDAERVILTKNDRSLFTEEDLNKIKQTKNVKNIIKYDVTIDNFIDSQLDDTFLSGVLYPIDMVNEKDITVGRMPQNENEVVISVSNSSMAKDKLEELGDKAIGTKIAVNDQMGTGDKLIPEDLVISGLIWSTKKSDASLFYGSDKIYASESLIRKIAVKQIALNSDTTVKYGKIKLPPVSDVPKVISDSRVPRGTAYIFEDDEVYFENASAKGKGVTISVKNTYFTSERWLKVSEIITPKNINSLIGKSKDDYGLYSTSIYVNPYDYATLYDKGVYQLSIMLGDETLSKDTVDSLQNAGFKCLEVKNTLQDISGGFSFVLKLISFAGLIIEMIVLFIISYSVIKLVMKSRNSYYATLRMLGASMKNTKRILKIELLLVMAIACVIDFTVIAMVKLGYITNRYLVEQVNFLAPVDVVVLFILLLGMSLLIGNRYSRKIFGKSAMKSFREGGDL